MQDEQFMIDSLGIQDWPEERRRAAVVEATMRVGEIIIKNVSEERYNEYKAIADDNHEVINNWLNENVPNYKENAMYKEIEAGYEADPEKNNPAKLFATIAWVQVNVPNLQELVDKTLADYKQELAAS